MSIDCKTVSQRGQIYAEILNVPYQLAEKEEYLFSLVLMVESRRMTQKNKIMSLYKDSLQPHFDKIRHIFCDFFNENSKDSRKKFFENKLIQHLWKLFIKESHSTFTDYINQLRKSNHGPEKVDRLFEDVMMLSFKTRFRVLPHELVTLISMREQNIPLPHTMRHNLSQMLNRPEISPSQSNFTRDITLETSQP